MGGEDKIKIKCIKTIIRQYKGKPFEFFTKGKVYNTSSEILYHIHAIGNKNEELIIGFMNEGGLNAPFFTEHFIIDETIISEEDRNKISDIKKYYEKLGLKFDLEDFLKSIKPQSIDQIWNQIICW